MKNRLKRVLAFVFGIALAPLWLMVWLFTGENIMHSLLIFAVNDDN